MIKSERIALALAALHLVACAATVPTTPETTEALRETAIPTTREIIVAERQPQAPSVPDRSGMRISIAAVGDMMLGTDYPQDHLPDDDSVGFLADVTATLSDADLAIGNLEGVLMDGGEPAKKCSNPSACYLFRSPTRYAERYLRAGFDVLSLANNHARDFGEEGRSSSMRALADYGMASSGREGAWASIESNGLRIAILAFAVTQGSNLLHDYDVAFSSVAEHASTHDIVIVSFHGGAEGAGAERIPFAEEEYYGEPRGDVVWFARGVVDAGADLVFGHGPHVVRGMELYEGRLIAYSLGNFATYYGISVTDMKGIAPIVTATMNGNGEFVGGQIVSTVQLRPNGPSVDPQHRALSLIRRLSLLEFGTPGLSFGQDGSLQPIERAPFERHELVVTPD